MIEFRASIVIGSGSLSFELIRALVQKLPVMLCPKWVSTPSQPIAIEDLLMYLIAALDLPTGPSEIFEIGGPDQFSYGQIMEEYCAATRVKARMIPIPFLRRIYRVCGSDWSLRSMPASAGNSSRASHPTLVTNSRALRLSQSDRAVSAMLSLAPL